MKIGLLLPIAETDRGTVLRYKAIRDAALQAERDRFDSIWVADHLLFSWEGEPRRGVWECWSLLAALAEATTQIEIGTFVACTAFRNPALLAKMADAVDEVSEGRLILGLGAGWHEPEFTAFGFPFDHLAGRFEDAVRIIAPLVRTGAVDFQGTYERAIDCASLPRGPRPQGPPILVGASGPRMLRVTASFADAWNTCWLARSGEFPARVEPLWAACNELGRDPQSLTLTVGQIATFPGLQQEQNDGDGIARFEFADADDLAAEWRAFERQGVAHLIVWPTPFLPECVDQVTAALRIFRDAGEE